MERSGGNQPNLNDIDIFTPERALKFLRRLGYESRQPSHETRALAIIARGNNPASLSEITNQVRETDSLVKAMRDRERIKALEREIKQQEMWQTIKEEAQIGKLNRFLIDGVMQPVSFVETTAVAEGVECDVYEFEGDETKDLGIIKIQGGCSTPLQRVVQGVKTLEGYISGRGFLDVVDVDETEILYDVRRDPKTPLVVAIGIGDTMLWHGERGSTLIAYEVCYPPYQAGRFENL